MARRKKVEAKNYDELIQGSEERIAALTADLKSEKANLKQLKKDKVIFCRNYNCNNYFNYYRYNFFYKKNE